MIGWLRGFWGFKRPINWRFTPLRGPLFENLVLTELLKGSFNQGNDAHIFFWRNNTGDEIDIIIEQANSLIPIEVKSGQTITGDFLTGIHKWTTLAGNASGTPYLVYGGGR
jgi:uncharacterized protein